MVQGFSAGGEFGSATAFLAEQNPERRGFFASWQFASQGLTTILATGFGVTLASTLTTEQMDSWGWRIPFIFGLLIGPVAYYIRRHLDETMEFQSTQPSKAPLREALSDSKKKLLISFGVGRSVHRGHVHDPVHADLCDAATRPAGIRRLSWPVCSPVRSRWC